MSDRNAEPERADREPTGPVGTVFGATFGPVAAAVGSVVDADRLAFTISFGTGVPGPTRLDDDGLDDAATIEIEETGSGEDEDGTGDGAEEGA